ncbi:hypothetical protein D3C72_1267100 [compost metagenome]
MASTMAMCCSKDALTFVPLRRASSRIDCQASSWRTRLMTSKIERNSLLPALWAIWRWSEPSHNSLASASVLWPVFSTSARMRSTSAGLARIAASCASCGSMRRRTSMISMKSVPATNSVTWADQSSGFSPTKVPAPCRRQMRPSASRTSSARRIDRRPTLKVSAKARSVGRRPSLTR